MISLLALAISLRPAAARFTRDFCVGDRESVGQSSPYHRTAARVSCLRHGPFDPAFFAHLSMLHLRGRARVSLLRAGVAGSGIAVCWRCVACRRANRSRRRAASATAAGADAGCESGRSLVGAARKRCERSDRPHRSFRSGADGRTDGRGIRRRLDMAVGADGLDLSFVHGRAARAAGGDHCILRWRTAARMAMPRWAAAWAS